MSDWPVVSRTDAAVLVVVISLVLVIGLAAGDHDYARDRSELSHVELGFPLTWVVQDQSALDPAEFPARMGGGSPLNHDTDVLWGRFVANVVLVSLGIGVACVAVSRRRKG